MLAPTLETDLLAVAVGISPCVAFQFSLLRNVWRGFEASYECVAGLRLALVVASRFVFGSSKSRKSKGLLSLSGGGQVGGLPPAASGQKTALFPLS